MSSDSESSEFYLQHIIDEDNKYFDQNVEIDDILKTKKVEENKIKITNNKMTKYEFVRIIGTRLQQLTKDAKPMIKNTKGLTNKEIVLLEIKNNMIPIKIKRFLPDNTFEIWKVSELEKDHLFVD